MAAFEAVFSRCSIIDINFNKIDRKATEKTHTHTYIHIYIYEREREREITVNSPCDASLFGVSLNGFRSDEAYRWFGVPRCRVPLPWRMLFLSNVSYKYMTNYKVHAIFT